MLVTTVSLFNIGNLSNKGNQDNIRNQSTSYKCVLVLM